MPYEKNLRFYAYARWEPESRQDGQHSALIDGPFNMELLNS